jgi:ubiquinone/menaquinone biosynthesis C-methylase UbiE
VTTGDTHRYDGPLAVVTARVMARANREAETEAVAELDPAPDAQVLAVGFGAGIGIEQLVERLPRGSVGGIDPSATMLRQATRRNREAVTAGRVELRLSTADAIPWPDASFDGIVAVNNLHLWEPIESSIAEIARVLRREGRLVTFTHDWAITRRTGRAVDDWQAQMAALCRRHGLVDAHCWRGRAEKGRSVAFSARSPNT